MQILVLGIFSLLFIIYSTSSDSWIKHQDKRLTPNTTLVADTSVVPNTYTFPNLHKEEIVYGISRVSKSKLDKEAIQKIMIRTCNAVYQKSMWNKCPNAESVTTAWAFATDISMKGSLAPVRNGSTSSTFSCGSEASYGRYLIKNTLPPAKANEYGYDLNGIRDFDLSSDGGGKRMYPCGYSEIIYKI